MTKNKEIEKYYAELKEVLIKSGASGICLDIDDTIAATNLFFARKYCSLFGNPENLSPEEIIAKYRYVTDVPYWQDPIKQNMIEEDFHLGEHVHLYPPISKAKEAVLKIDRTISIAFYLTGRPYRFYNQTCVWLDRHEFPQRRILMEPERGLLEKLNVIDGNEWKARLLELLFPEIVGTIDDNLGIAELISSDYKGLIFLYSHTGNYPSRPNVIHCPTWENTEMEINRIFGRKNS